MCQENRKYLHVGIILRSVYLKVMNKTDPIPFLVSRVKDQKLIGRALTKDVS